jgi:hypothetical protein
MLAALFFLAVTGGGEEEKLVQSPSVNTTEPWLITVGGPGWLANVGGITGFRGFNSNISVDVGQILRHINVIYAFNGDVRKGRFNLNKAFYLTAETDVGGFGVGSDIAVQVYAASGCHVTRNIYSQAANATDGGAVFHFTLPAFLP